MKGLRRLADSVYLLPGSPNTLLVAGGDVVCIVDPGIGEGRSRLIEESLRGLGASGCTVLLTHGHTDHLAAAAELHYSRLLTSRLCAPLVESLETRFAMVYGGLVTMSFASMPPVTLKVDSMVEPGSKPCSGVEAVALPGHTPGHMGYIVEGGVVAAGDSILGERVLARFGIPFAYNLRRWMESLDTLEELARAGYTLVPGHGPVASGGRARALVEANRKAAIRVYNTVLEELERKPMTPGELAIRVTERLASVELTPRQIALNRTTIVSVLAWLEEEGRAEPALTEAGVVWRLRS